MLDMKIDDYLEITEKMQEEKDILESYIPTDEDIEEMKKNPDKYMLFMNYFLNVEREVEQKKELSQEEAERLEEVKKQINKIVSKNLILK